MENQEKQWPQLSQLQEFRFENTTVLAGIMTTGEAIALKPVCENLGLDWSSQLKRLKRDPIQSQLWSYSKMLSTDGKAYDMVSMKPHIFQNWLYTLNPSGNLKLKLWESYKQSLVIFLMESLRISMDEVLRLRGLETEFNLFKVDVTAYIDAHNAGKEYTKSAKEKFKEANGLEKKLLDRMHNINANQLSLLFQK